MVLGVSKRLLKRFLAQLKHPSEGGGFALDTGPVASRIEFKKLNVSVAYFEEAWMLQLSHNLNFLLCGLDLVEGAAADGL